MQASFERCAYLGKQLEEADDAPGFLARRRRSHDRTNALTPSPWKTPTSRWI